MRKVTDLNYNHELKMFEFSDSYSKVYYAPVQSLSGIEIPCFAVFVPSTRGKDELDYVTFVSKQYRFVGNGEIIDSIQKSVPGVSLDVKMYRNFNKTEFRFSLFPYELAQQENVIVPEIAISNSYIGTSSERISFGLAFKSGVVYRPMALRKTFGEFRQIHRVSQKTKVFDLTKSYIDSFSSSIQDLINDNREVRLDTDDIIEVMKRLEGLGKTRITKIQKMIEEEQESKPLSAWRAFTLFSEFITEERQLAVRSKLEQVAESILIIPSKLKKFLDEKNRSKDQSQERETKESNPYFLKE